MAQNNVAQKYTINIEYDVEHCVWIADKTIYDTNLNTVMSLVAKKILANGYKLQKFTSLKKIHTLNRILKLSMIVYIFIFTLVLLSKI